MQELIKNACDELCRLGKVEDILLTGRCYRGEALELGLLFSAKDTGLSWLFPVMVTKDAEKLQLLQAHIYIDLSRELNRDLMAQHFRGFSPGFVEFAKETANLGDDYGETMYRRRRLGEFLQAAQHTDQTTKEFVSLQAEFDTQLQGDVRKPEADAEVRALIGEVSRLEKKRARDAYDARVKEISRKLLKKEGAPNELVFI